MLMASIHHDKVYDYDFADRALALRQRAGLTQRELAAYLGVNYKAIGAWEGGISYPGTERLRQLIALYRERGTLHAGCEEEEATALWESVRATARRRTAPFDPHWFAALSTADGTGTSAASPSLTVVSPVPAPPNARPIAEAALPVARHDWGEAPDVPVPQGRTQELVTLDRWVREEHCRLVLLLGEGGMGKTTLAARLAHALAPAFAAVYWRDLRAAPLPEDWLAGAIAALRAGPAPLPEGVEARLGLLLELLRQRPGLLVLDNLETILEPGIPEVGYRAGYEGYGEILRRLGTSMHQGCVLVTSREQPLREDGAAVRVLRLRGLGVDDARALLDRQELAGDEAAWHALVAHYGGNPLALQAAGATIATVFGGDLAPFLALDVAVVGEIRQLLAAQVARLSVPEHAVLTWVAEERRPVRFAALVTNLRPMVGCAAVVEAVEALARRSLLVPGDDGTFTLVPVLRQYATPYVGERAGQRGAAQDGGHGCAAQAGASGRATTAVARACRGGSRTRQNNGPGCVVNPWGLHHARRPADCHRISGRMAAS